MAIKSRIHQFFSEDCMKELNKVKRDVLISDNNKKIDLFCAILDKYDVPYTELGGGTNRFCIMIDNYAFKIAMDKDGEKDNWMEFSLTQELQPFVVKCYECNGLILVTEYVNLVTRDEFMAAKEEMRLILSYIAQSYLLGDVGTIPKNFTNWGYRDSGEWVILDFAYLYRIRGEEMKCGHVNKAGETCDTFLEYDYDYSSLRCPRCGHKYMFNEIRGRISKEFEEEEVEFVKNLAYVVTQPVTEFGKEGKKEEDDDDCEEVETRKEVDKMGRNHNYEVTEEEAMDAYLAALASLKKHAEKDEEEQEPELETDFEKLEETVAEMVEDIGEEPVRLIDEDGEVINGEDDEEPEYETSPFVDPDPFNIAGEEDTEDEWVDEPVEICADDEWFEEREEDEPETVEEVASDETFIQAMEDISENKEKYNQEVIVDECEEEPEQVKLFISKPEEPVMKTSVEEIRVENGVIKTSVSEVSDGEVSITTETIETAEVVVEEDEEDPDLLSKIDIGMGMSIDIRYTEPAPQVDEERSFLRIEKPSFDDDEEDEYDEMLDEAVLENLEAKYESKKKFR